MNNIDGDERIVEYLAAEGYHPRSPTHGSKQCRYFLADMLGTSERMRAAAQNGAIVFEEDYTVGEGQDRWNTDLVIGPPAADDIQGPSDDAALPIAEAEPEHIWLAIDAKSVMTEHGKARRNRQRDINSFADIMHTHHPGAITGGLILINMAERFRSPLRDEGDVTQHDRIEQLVQETVEIFRTIDRAQGDVSPNVDAVACVVVKHTNLDDGTETRLVTDPPAPQPGDIVRYEDVVELLVETFEQRWLLGEPPEIAGPEDSDDLGVALDHAVVELAHRVKELRDGLKAETVSDTQIEAVAGQLAELERLLDKIDE